MPASKTNKGPARACMLAAALCLGISPAFAQEPGTAEDVNTTMGVIADPNASEPTDIVRKIPSARPKRSAKSTDAVAKDLTSPGRDDTDGESGSPDPYTPPNSGQGPDPTERVDDIGNEVTNQGRNRGDEARRHHDSPPPGHGPKDKPDRKPPRGPGSKPPESPPGGKPPRDSQPPGHRPPGTHPPRPNPPGGPPRGPRPHPPSG